MENMEETIERITSVCDRIQQEIGKRIAEVVEHDLEGLTESMARMPLWTEKCFDSETAALIGVWDRLNSTVGDLLMLDNEDDDHHRHDHDHHLHHPTPTTCVEGHLVLPARVPGVFQNVEFKEKVENVSVFSHLIFHNVFVLSCFLANF